MNESNQIQDVEQMMESPNIIPEFFISHIHKFSNLNKYNAANNFADPNGLFQPFDQNMNHYNQVSQMM